MGCKGSCTDFNDFSLRAQASHSGTTCFTRNLGLGLRLRNYDKCSTRNTVLINDSEFRSKLNVERELLRNVPWPTVLNVLSNLLED